MDQRWCGQGDTRVQQRAHRSSASGRYGAWKLTDGSRKERGENGDPISGLTIARAAVWWPGDGGEATTEEELDGGIAQSWREGGIERWWVQWGPAEASPFYRSGRAVWGGGGRWVMEGKMPPLMVDRYRARGRWGGRVNEEKWRRGRSLVGSPDSLVSSGLARCGNGWGRRRCSADTKRKKRGREKTAWWAGWVGRLTGLAREERPHWPLGLRKMLFHLDMNSEIEIMVWKLI
jgi:hypothetical protein